MFTCLKHERSIHHYYNNFSISDLVVIPDFSTGAEENWGLIGFTSPMLLFDPEKTSDNIKQGVCETITHELAHQVSQRSVWYEAISVASCLPLLLFVKLLNRSKKSVAKSFRKRII